MWQEAQFVVATGQDFAAGSVEFALTDVVVAVGGCWSFAFWWQLKQF